MILKALLNRILGLTYVHCVQLLVMSDFLRPHGLQPVRPLCPQDFPGKNIGVGCHALLQGIFPTQESNLHLLHLLHCRTVLYHWVTGCGCCQVTSVESDSVRPHRRQPNRLLCPWDSPGKNTGVGCHILLQCMHAKSLQSCPTPCNPMDNSPPSSSVHRILWARILEWVAISFSTREAHIYTTLYKTDN